MPRPGVTVTLVEEVYPGAAALDTGQALMVGQCERGSVTKPISITSMDDYRTKCGDRAGGSLLYDAASMFFAEGGGNLKVSRAIGTGAVVAFVQVSTSGLKANATSPGTWGNSLTVRFDAVPGGGANDRYVVVLKSGVEVDRSYKVSTPEEAISWSVGRNWIEFVTGSGSGMPAAATSSPLAGGTAGAAVVAADTIAAINRFPFALGPGQLLVPGNTDTNVHIAMCQHCDANYRVALIDLANSATIATLTAALEAIRAGGVKARNTLILGGWVNVPYYETNTIIQVPYSGIQAGIIARVDRLGDPAQVAAGANAISRVALSLVQAYSDADRFTLNEAGITMPKEIYGQVRTYGNRTGAGSSERNWLFFQESRVVMGIAHDSNAAMEDYVLQTIDGKGWLFSKVNNVLQGVCMEYYNAGALYGDTPEEAFLIDTGPGVNTIDTIKNGEVHATVKVKTSKVSEWVQINLVKTPIERPL